VAEHPSPFALEAWHAGGESAVVREHVAACGACKAYVEGLEGAKSRLSRRGSADDFARAIRARAEKSGRTRGWRMLVPAAALAATMVLIFVRYQTNSEKDVVRLKGGSQLAVIVLRQGEQTRHLGRLDARAGDRLRFEIVLEKPARMSVGVIEDGRFTSLARDESFDAGLHHLEATLEVDPGPMHALVVAGPPERLEAIAKKGELDSKEGQPLLELESR
jgi:anti-sigma-K factor RskA